MKSIVFIVIFSLVTGNTIGMDKKTLNRELASAMNGERWEEVRKVIEQGADISTQDPWGNTALHQAAFWGSHEMVIFLLEKGADRHLQNKKGRTPADLAKKGTIEYSDPKWIKIFATIYELLKVD